jgi:iron complex outermembrane recepter protein
MHVFVYRRLCFAVLCLLPVCGLAQTSFSPRDIKKLSVEELMNLEVSLVSRTPEKLSEAPSAIQVITSEDIRRSGATNIPEALRLSPNLQVSQLSAHTWLISARGFNTIFANKLLVMIDGRTVYTPLYAGVLWEQQNVLLEDVDRIEIVSGPGGNLWGANAVNGIINIVTKQAGDTQGLYASVLAGTFIKDQAAIRYGNKAGKVNYKFYGQHFNRGATKSATSGDNKDDWSMSQAGFRMDWNSNAKNAFTVQGDYYDGNRNAPKDRSPLNGQNILGRWTKTISERSELSLQVYYDRYYREDAPTGSYDKMNTADIDFQHRFPLKAHSIVWGAGYRYVKDDANFPVTGAAGIVPRFKRLDLYSAFIRDEVSLTRHLLLTFGTKVLHNVYTGVEWQPDVRLAWVNKGNTVWAAISRAVRTPSRLDVEYFLPMTPQPPTVPSVAGGPNFESEKLVAYEAGYRFLPNSVSAFSISAFYNVYRDVYSVEALPGTLTYQIQNGSQAESWGAEISGNYQVHKNWRVRGGYTFFKKDIYAKPGRVFNPDYLGNDARNIVVLQSILDLPWRLQLDVTARYLDHLPQTFATRAVDAYFTYDARLAFAHKGFEFSIVGQNLAHKKHIEFGTYYIPRNVYAKISARF